ncbi:hypothetical protein F5Y15DRAFT_110876 [Xylariaceae sp. FL0016]|nr:hypothetical protein F5Y15DRAFT_110876 [Xylariaceae sp. FL0016]
MILKNTTIALCSTRSPSHLCSLTYPQACRTPSCKPATLPGGGDGPKSSVTSIPSVTSRSNTHVIRRSRFNRGFATISDTESSSNSTSHVWPSCPHPTPYDIFNQQRHAPYSKAKFYELVKIYHPDRHRVSSGPAISQRERLERYRLVVTAHEILSDPVKRRAYNLYGAGWGDVRSMSSDCRNYDKSWRDEPGNPSMNATWEDWERWYGEKNGEKKKQQPLYMSNELFVGVLCAFVVIGSMGQARRANTTTMNVVEMRDQKHTAISQDMRHKQHSQALLNRHERIESFLRQRDGWNIASSTSSAPASLPEAEKSK